MTDTEQKALALLNEKTGREFGCLENAYPFQLRTALLCSIEAHEATKAEFEAFRKDVSDAVKDATADWSGDPCEGAIAVENLKRFILPKPVDPLVEVLGPIFANTKAGDSLIETADRLRKDLAARGGRVVFGEE